MNNNGGGSSFSATAWEAAEKRWWALPGRRRKEVSRLSKEGRVHPDPEVAQIAYRWAVMQVQVGKRNFLTKPAVAIPMALITLPIGGGTAGMTILYWKRVRFARRVVAVTEKSRKGPAAATCDHDGLPAPGARLLLIASAVVAAEAISLTAADIWW